LIIRPKIASQEVSAYRRFERADDRAGVVDLRDRLVNRFHPNEGDLLELDLQPFTTTPLRFVTPKNIAVSQPLSIQQAVSRSPAMAGELI